MATFFTADEHYGHSKIIEYCSRPFGDVEEMNEEIVFRHNKTVVNEDDLVIHAGDFAFGDTDFAYSFIDRLRGRHIFLRGSHDRWMRGCYRDIWKRKEAHWIVVCHYPLMRWEGAHYNSWHLFGHVHCRGWRPAGKTLDIGVDCHDFYPVSEDEVAEIMKDRPDNFGLVRRD